MPREPGRYAARRLLIAIAIGLVAMMLVFKTSAHNPRLTEHNHQADDQAALRRDQSGMT